MAEPDVISAISLPPREAIAFLRQKTNQTTERWSDVWNEAHARAFSVAGAASEALVQDFRDAVTKAIEQGTTLAEFRRDFDSIVARHGWVHNGTAAWRSQIIYETNLSGAYSAGRYVQMTDPDVLAAYPYWRYQHNAALHPRVQHLAWSGLVLRADDPWWQTHYPPNGWRCHCSVSPVSDRALRRMGRTAPDTAPPLDMQAVRIRQGDGFRSVETPRGIDPGFGYNPGAAWQGRVQPGAHDPLSASPISPLRAETVAPPKPPTPAAAPAGEGHRPTARPPASPAELQRWLRDPVGNLPVGQLHPDLAKSLGADTREVLLSPETLEKQQAHHPELTVHDYAELADLVAKPDLALAGRAKHITLIRRAGRILLSVIKATADGSETYAVTLYRIRPDRARKLAGRAKVILGSLQALLGKGE